VEGDAVPERDTPSDAPHATIETAIAAIAASLSIASVRCNHPPSAPRASRSARRQHLD
jgi:hypothetical protein